MQRSHIPNIFSKLHSGSEILEMEDSPPKNLISILLHL